MCLKLKPPYQALDLYWVYTDLWGSQLLSLLTSDLKFDECVVICSPTPALRDKTWSLYEMSLVLNLLA